MTVKNAERSLGKISKLLEKKHDAREFLIKNSRGIVIACSKSIIAVHRGDTREAESGLQNAGRLLKEYRKKSDCELKKYLVVPEQEFVEAAALIAIAEKNQIPSRDTLKVSEEAYVLGLLDCIGELKRFVLDRIRSDCLSEAMRVFHVMEELFSLLYPFAGLDRVIKEARRKIDVNRMLVEDTRAIVTQEIRRKDLIDTIKGLD